MTVAELRLPDNANLERVGSLCILTGGTLGLDRIEGTLEPATTTAIGAVLGAIDPWARYRFPAERLGFSVGIGAPGTVRLMVRDGEFIAAIAVLKPGWMFGTYLNLLAVLPAFQGRGIGGAFLDWLKAEGLARGERNQFVVASAFNTRALALYERHGFGSIAQMPGLINDAETEILLRRRLGASLIG